MADEETPLEEQPIDEVLSEEDFDDGALESAFVRASEGEVAPEVAPEETPAEPQLTAEMESLLDRARSLGIQPERMSDPLQLSEALLEQMGKMQPMVSYAQQFAPYQNDFQAYLAQRSQPQQPPQTTPQQPQSQSNEWDQEAYFQEKYGGPTWKSEFQNAIEQGIVQRDPETGLWTPAPGAEMLAANILPDLNASQQQQAKFWKNWSQGNPYKDIYGVIKEPLIREVQQLINQVVETRETKQSTLNEIDQFLNQNESWMYQTDPNTGKEVESPLGEQFFQTVDQLRAKGLADPKDLIELAMLKIGKSAEPAPQQQPVAQAQPVAQEAPKPEEPKESFLNKALKRAQHSPSSNVSTANAPQVVTEGDLDSMFVRAARAS